MSGTAEFVQGWYADPHGGGGLRWWDGAAWTDHVATEPTGSTQGAAETTQTTVGVTGAADATENGTVDASPTESASERTGPSPAAAPVAEQTVVVMRKTPRNTDNTDNTDDTDDTDNTDEGAGGRPAGGTPARAPFVEALPAQAPVVQGPPTTSFPVHPAAALAYPAQPDRLAPSPASGAWAGYDAQPVAAPGFGQPAPGFGQPGPFGQYGVQPGPQYPSQPAAWLPDPHGPGLRWWDGSTWTAHTAPSPQAQGGNTVNVHGGGTTVVVGGGGKSVGVAFLLTFFFGPIGLLYATVTGGLIMIGVELFLLVLGIITFGLAWLLFGFTWVICIVWGCVAAGKQTPVQVVHH